MSPGPEPLSSSGVSRAWLPTMQWTQASLEEGPLQSHPWRPALLTAGTWPARRALHRRPLWLWPWAVGMPSPVAGSPAAGRELRGTATLLTGQAPGRAVSGLGNELSQHRRMLSATLLPPGGSFSQPTSHPEPCEGPPGAGPTQHLLVVGFHLVLPTPGHLTTCLFRLL